MSIPRPTSKSAGVPHYGEMSNLRSKRDSDVTVRAWQKGGDIAGQLFVLTNAVAELQRQLARLRMRGGGSATGYVRFRGSYDSTLSDILTDDMFVARYDDYGANAGLYICVKDHPTGSDLPWNDPSEFWVQLAKNDTIGRWS